MIRTIWWFLINLPNIFFFLFDYRNSLNHNRFKPSSNFIWFWELSKHFIIVLMINFFQIKCLKLISSLNHLDLLLYLLLTQFPFLFDTHDYWVVFFTLFILRNYTSWWRLWWLLFNLNNRNFFHFHCFVYKLPQLFQPRFRK